MFPVLIATTYLASGLLLGWPLVFWASIFDMEFLVELRFMLALGGAFAVLTSASICAYVWPRGDALASILGTKRILLYGAAALILPFVLEVAWMEAARRAGPGFPGYGSFLSQAVCACVGGIVLARSLRGWMFLAAVVYVPLMLAALIPFSVAWSCGIYRDCL